MSQCLVGDSTWARSTRRLRPFLPGILAVLGAALGPLPRAFAQPTGGPPAGEPPPLVGWAQNGPDLWTMPLALPSLDPVRARQRVQLRVTTLNRGDAEAPASVTAFYWTRDGRLVGTARELARMPVPGLPAHQPTTGTVTFDVPDVPDGTYYLTARANATGAVRETSLSNNEATLAVSVGIAQPAVDYMVTWYACSPVTGLIPGCPVALTAKTENVGRAAGNLASYTGFFWSGDPYFDVGDIYLGAAKTPPLGVGFMDQQTLHVNVPPNTPDGTYYVLIWADCTRVVPESNEDNNLWCRIPVTVKGLPDYVVTDVSCDQGTYLQPGAEVVVRMMVANVGSCDAERESNAALLWSANRTADEGDTRLTSVSVPPLPAGRSSVAAVTVTLPEVPRGRYYLIPYADCDDVLMEVDNGNNATQRLCLDLGSSPDYAVTNLTCKPTTGLGPGTALEVEVQTTNVGDAPAPPKGTTHTALFWSTDKTRDEADLRLGDGGLLPPLSEGAGRSQRFTVKAPDGVGPGTYYLIAVANLERTVPEPDEKNNCFAVAVVVGPVR